MKVIHGEYAMDGAAVQRFLTMMRVLQRVDDQAIQPIVAAGKLEDGRPYVISEWVEGKQIGALAPLPLIEAGVPAGEINDISQTVVKMSLMPGVALSDASAAMVSKAAELNLKLEPGVDRLAETRILHRVRNRFAGFPLFHKIGASRLEQTICAATARAGWVNVCGKVGGTPPERAEEAELIVIWGMNVKVSNLHFWPYVVEARKRGARLLVIDPYRNDTARSADEHIWVRPGGDAALALGVLKLMVAHEWVDDEFIDTCSSGFDELKAYLRDTRLDDFEDQSGVAVAGIGR